MPYLRSQFDAFHLDRQNMGMYMQDIKARVEESNEPQLRPNAKMIQR